MRARTAYVAADAAAVGCGLVSVLNLLDWAARRGLGDLTVPEVARLKLVGSLSEVVFRGGISVASNPRWWRLAILAGFGLTLWRRTRPLMHAAAGVGVAVSIGWIAALLCSVPYLLDPLIGPFVAPISILPAAVLAHNRRWPVSAMMVVAVGLALGTLAVQFIITQPYLSGIVDPLYGFIPPVVLSVAAAWGVSRYRGNAPLMGFTRRLILFGGLSAVCFCTTFAVVLEASQLRARSPEPSGTRVVSGWAYDVLLAGEPPAIVWTDRRRIQVLDDAYGDTHHRYALDETAGMVERVWPSATGGFYVQADRSVG